MGSAGVGARLRNCGASYHRGLLKTGVDGDESLLLPLQNDCGAYPGEGQTYLCESKIIGAKFSISEQDR